MVERVEGFCSEADWKRAYQEINEMEENFHHFGSIVIKFWLQIDPHEQLRRFRARENDPRKRWKLNDEDWRNREKWPQYEEAVEEMVRRTGQRSIPQIFINRQHIGGYGQLIELHKSGELDQRLQGL